jgi:hypothetical protein
VDIVDRVATDTMGNEVVHLDDAEGVDAKAEDVDHLHRQRRTQTSIRLAGNLHHFLVEEQERRHHQIL